MQRIYPGGGPHLDDVADLAAAYAFPEPSPGDCWIRAMMISSLDGAAQGPDGKSGSLSSPADRWAFALQRGLADAILVGAGTVRAEGYGPAEVEPAYEALRHAAGQLAAPPIVVVSRQLDLDPAAPLFTEEPRRTIVVTVDSAPRQRRTALAAVADVVVAGDADVDLAAVRAALAERGYRRIVCEGGPHLLATVLAGGHVDELCLTFAPMTVGGTPLRLLGELPMAPRDWRLAHVIEDDGTLLTRWTRIEERTGRMGT